MPHLNELEAEFGSRGLSVVGVTGETKEKTEPWIEKHKVGFAYAYDPDKALFRGLRLRAYPSAVLVSPRGEVVWKGHPMALTNSEIDQHLRFASRIPVETRAKMRSWPAAAASVVKLVDKNKLAKALDEAEELAAADPATPGVVDDLTAYVDGVLGDCRGARDAGDFLTALETAEDFDKALSGHARGVAFQEIVKEIRGDKTAGAAIKTQKKLLKLGALIEQTSASKLPGLIKTLDKIEGEYRGTFVGKQARALLTRANRKLVRG